MDGVIRQLYDYDGSNLFPRTKPNAFVSDFEDSTAVGIRTIGEHIDTSTPTYEPEFVYRIKGSDPVGTVDSSGDLFATKISDIPGIVLNSILSSDLTVSNPVGQATQGKTYRKGTSLETIIRDMLAGGATIYDVAKTLVNVQFSSVMVNGSSVSNNGSINIDSGTATISFRTTYADGYFYPSNNYPQDIFRTLHEAQQTYDQNNNRLYADSSPNSLKITNGNSIEYNANPSTLEALRLNGSIEVSKQINITSGNQIFVITLNCAAQPNYVNPMKSNGTLSNQSISNSSFQYTFTVIGSGVTVYDVSATDPSIMPALTQTQFNISVFNKNYDLSQDQTTNFILKSNWDIENDSSTGLWTGDSAILYTKKSLFNNWEFSGPDVIDTDGTNIEISTPSFIFLDGFFTRRNGYDENLFISNNPQVVKINNILKLYANCQLNNNPSIGIYKASQAIKVIDAPYDTITKKQDIYWAFCESDGTQKIVYGTFIDFINKNNGILNTIFDSSGNDYKLKFTLPYTGNNVTPKKSNGENSLEYISPENIILESNSFEVKQEADVIAINPSIDSPSVEFFGFPDVFYDNNQNIPYDTYHNKTLLFKIKYHDGYYKPDSTWEQQLNYIDEFNNINNTNGGRLSSNNILSSVDFTVKKGNEIINVNSTTDQDGEDLYMIYLPLEPIENDIKNSSISFTFSGTYSESTTEPKKRSTRPSNVTIQSGNTQPRIITLFFEGENIVTKTLYISHTGTGDGSVRYKFGEGEYAAWNSSYEIPVAQNTWVTVDATTNDIFEKWSLREEGTQVSSQVDHTPTSFQMSDKNYYATAHFRQKVTESRALTIGPNPVNEGCYVKYKINDGEWSQNIYNVSTFSITKNSSVTIEATEGDGYNFINWTNNYNDNIITSSTSYTFDMNENYSFSANFNIETQHCIAKAISNGDGSVRIGYNNTWTDWSNSSVSLSVITNDDASFEAMPNTGYTFDYWKLDMPSIGISDRIIGSQNPYNMSIGYDCSVTAYFTQTNTLNLIPGSDGSVRYQTTNYNGTWGSWSNYSNSTITTPIRHDSSVNIQASPESGYRFVEWVNPDNNDSLISSSNPYEFRMLNDSSIKAVFTQIVSNDEYHYIMLTTNYQDVNDPSLNYGSITEMLNDPNVTELHFDDTSTSMPAPYVKEGKYPGVGGYFNVFVIAAPVDYKSAKIFVQNVGQNTPFTIVPPVNDNNGIPYLSESTDNIKYRLFKYFNPRSTGFLVNKVEIYKTE